MQIGLRVADSFPGDGVCVTPAQRAAAKAKPGRKIENPFPGGQPTGVRVCVTYGSWPMYLEPDKNRQGIGTVYSNTPYKILGVEREWTKLDAFGGPGWWRRKSYRHAQPT